MPVRAERGTMSRLTAFFALVVVVSVTKSQAAPDIVPRGICVNDFCNCTQAIHPVWTTISCNLPKDSKLDVFNGDLPDTTIELSVKGGEAVMFGQGAFNNVEDMRRISLKGPKLVLFRQFTAANLNLLNLYLEIEGTDIVRFEKIAFMHLRGPLSVKIINCNTVSVEGLAFSWLLRLEVTNVKQLLLGAGSFTLEPTAANVGEHGPGMSIELKNTTIPEFARSTFGSSLAKLLMVGVDVHAIRTGAFSANTYNVVMAINCSIHLIEEEAFSQNSLINYLNFEGSKIQQIDSRAVRSAIANINISHTRFDNVQSGAINTTVASVIIIDSEFHKFMEKGFELTSWNKLQMERNSFDELPPNAIAAPGASIHELVFNDNEIETMYPESLAFIGKAAATRNIRYSNNYYGQPCNCKVSEWLAKALGEKSGVQYEAESFCTVDEFFARCFNVPEQNMLFKRFINKVCSKSPEIKCEQFKVKTENGNTEIKNPRFPHKIVGKNTLTARNKKVIGIILVSCSVFVIIAVLFSLIRCMRRRGHCLSIKDFLISSNSCGPGCGLLSNCDTNLGHDNARSISQMSVIEYSEHHRLNESRPQELAQEPQLQDQTEAVTVPTMDQFTQTLPEELTKELLENLKDELENPAKFGEAQETIEHLYALSKMKEPAMQPVETENIYELPDQGSNSHIGRNNKMMISVGTETLAMIPLMPQSPYYRHTALAHEYFEPRDLAVHLYAEIANNDREKRMLLGGIPDVVSDQPEPRGPYLRAVLQNTSSPFNSPSTSSVGAASGPVSSLTTKSNSSSSSSSGRMMNRPLPEKPCVLSTEDPPPFVQI